MVALEDLDEGETVFKIPRNVLLEPNTSSLCETVSEFAKNLPEIHTRYFFLHAQMPFVGNSWNSACARRRNSQKFFLSFLHRNKWLPLLVTLLFEYTNPESKWRPYLDLVPRETVLNQPIFWSELEREYLTLVGLKDGVESDETNIEEGYREFVLPFVDKHTEFFE
jgi:hypothetical protein